MYICAPKNKWELSDMMKFAVGLGKPIAVRYPRGIAYAGLREYSAPIEPGKAEWIYRESGIALLAVGSMVKTAEEVRETLFAASGYSVHSVENQIRQGFVTAKCGERVGIAGSVVYDGNGVLSVHSVSSLCIRVPHEIRGCARELFDRCLSDGLKSVLVMSPPGVGKTTILRDLSSIVCEKYGVNVLVSDERGELSAGDTGSTSDVMRFADKSTAFTAGIRAMRPDVIVTDELLTEDYAAVRRAIEGGIHVFASAHLVRMEDVPQKLFDRYVRLNGLGRIGRIYGAEYVD